MTLSRCSAAFFLLLLLAACVPGAGAPTAGPSSPGSVPVENVFPEKIVYTMSMDVERAPLERDCAARGGRFNECGSPCPATAEGCAAVCALTCELQAKR